MTPTTTEREARELLAREYERDGQDFVARCLRYEPDVTTLERRSIRAIIAALTREQREGVVTFAVDDVRFDVPASIAEKVAAKLAPADNLPQPETPGAVAWTDKERVAIEELMAAKELSYPALMRQAIRYYQADEIKRRNGETVEWAGDAQRARDFAGPLLSTPPAPVDVREKYDDVLLPFLALMRKELHANAGKGDRPGWLTMDRKTSLLELYYHLSKLQKAMKDDNAEGIREYAADVANMAMMAVDVCGQLDVALLDGQQAMVDDAMVRRAVHAYDEWMIEHAPDKTDAYYDGMRAALQAALGGGGGRDG